MLKLGSCQDLPAVLASFDQCYEVSSHQVKGYAVSANHVNDVIDRPMDRRFEGTRMARGVGPHTNHKTTTQE